MIYINEFREKLRKKAEALNAQYLQSDVSEKLELEIFRETSTPMTVRLKRLIESIPTSERNKPRSLEWYRTRLRGIQGRGGEQEKLVTLCVNWGT